MTHSENTQIMALTRSSCPSSSPHPSLRPVDITDVCDDLSFLTAHFSPIDSSVFFHSVSAVLNLLADVSNIEQTLNRLCCGGKNTLSLKTFLLSLFVLLSLPSSLPSFLCVSVT